MSDSALVTVIVPGWNVESFADAALSSLRAQTMPAWEAVLVDDASDDETGALFDRAAEGDPRFRVIHHDRRRGLGAARNTALETARTPFIAFLDADDLFTSDALERLVSTLRDSGSDLVVGAYVRLRPDARGDYSPGTVQPWVRAATAPARRGVTLADHPAASGNIVAWSKLSRIELWHDLRFPEGRLYEDQIVAQHMYTRARAFDVIPDVVVHWRERADGSSITQRTDRLEVLRDYTEALAAGIDVLDAAGAHHAVRERVALILGMDLPPLIDRARDHPEQAYRRALGAFTRDVLGRAPGAAAALTAPQRRAVSAASLW